MKPDRFIIILPRAVVFALALVGLGAVCESLCVLGIDLDRSIEVLDGAVVLASLVVSRAAVVEGACVLGVELERFVIVLDGAVVFLLGGIGIAAVVMGNGHGRRALHARLDQRGAAIDLEIGR